MPDAASLDGVNVYGIKRVVANLDDDPEEEMAVLINYSTGMCTSCADQVIFAILDKQNETIRIAWRNEGYSGDSNISTVKLFREDKFFELAASFDTGPGSVSMDKKLSIVRWTGKQFAEIWSTNILDYDSGAHEGNPHSFLAKVDFVENRTGVKRIRVTGVYSTPPYAKERNQYASYEEFSWNESAQRYLAIRQYEAADLVELLEELKAPQNLIDSTKETEEGALERVMGY